ncbi:hypothetical protein D3C76_978320 [compost metagenome]
MVSPQCRNHAFDLRNHVTTTGNHDSVAQMQVQPLDFLEVVQSDRRDRHTTELHRTDFRYRSQYPSTTDLHFDAFQDGCRRLSLELVRHCPTRGGGTLSEGLTFSRLDQLQHQTVNIVPQMRTIFGHIFDCLDDVGDVTGQPFPNRQGNIKLGLDVFRKVRHRHRDRSSVSMDHCIVG